MNKIAILLFSTLLVFSCGIQHQLKRSFRGKPATSLETRFGNPVTIIETAEDSIYIFEKTEELRSTEISQGRLTLDPIVTPKTNKTERYYFTVKNGIIVKIRFEEKYERKN